MPTKTIFIKITLDLTTSQTSSRYVSIVDVAAYILRKRNNIQFQTKAHVDIPGVYIITNLITS